MSILSFGCRRRKKKKKRTSVAIFLSIEEPQLYVAESVQYGFSFLFVRGKIPIL